MSKHTHPKDHLEAISAVEEAAGDRFFSSEIADLRRKITDRTFNLAVLGQFKRGKTSFINALIGEDLLPTSVVPLTSIITVLRHGVEVSLRIVYKDGREHSADLGDLALYVTEKSNPGNAKGVALAEVFYPSDFLRGGVLLIDTPGVGSVYRHNSEVTYSYLKNVDAALFLLTADQPLSSEELSFLRDVRAHAVKTFFILNKKDYLSEPQLKESLEYNREVLCRELGGEQEIYPVSARWALEGRLGGDKDLLERSGIPAFSSHLKEFLDTRREEVFHESVEARIRALTDSIIGYLMIEREAINRPIEETKARLERFRRGAEEIRREQRDAEPVIRAEIRRIIDRVEEDLVSFRKEKEKELTAALEKRFCELEGGDNKKLYSEFLDFYTKTLTEVFEPFREQEEEKVR